ncbi:hypothetical protein VR010_11110 [Actinomycetaceae bacterium L2_0104]
MSVVAASGEEVLSRSISGYAPIDGADLLSETSGWVLGSGTTSTTVTDLASNTGLTTAVSSLDAAGATTSSIATGYDAWVREVTYTDRDGQTTTTAYDDAGRVATVTDPQGTIANTYDSDTDHRGFLTKLDVSGTGSYTATYDAAGNMVSQTMPGGLTQTSSYDRVGNETSLSYSLKRGDAAPIQIATWSIARDRAGRIDSLSGPARASSYTYDLTGRLVTGSDTLDDTCTTRTYGFDTNSNRTNMSASTRVGSCDGQSVEQTDKQWTYDAGNRVQNGANGVGGYVYDAFGRQTSIPVADTVNGSDAGDAKVAYYDNDLVASTTQNGSVTTYSLDPVERRAEQVTTTGGQTKRVVRHYTDSGDNPGWASYVSNGTTSVTRYSASIGGDLSASLTGGVVTLEIVDPIGNIATSLTVDNGIVTPKPLNHWDEYGNQINNVVPAAGPIAYGWLGGKERAVEPTSSLILMGVRLYNPRTGLFTSVDPVPGGNTTEYTYPQDPINKQDLDGKLWGWIKKNWRKALNVGVFGLCLVASAGACLGAGLVTAAVTNTHRTKTGWSFHARSFAIDATFIVGGGGITRMAGKSWSGSAFRKTSTRGAQRYGNRSAPAHSTKRNARHYAHRGYNYPSHIRNTSYRVTRKTVALNGVVGVASWRGSSSAHSRLGIW